MYFVTGLSISTNWKGNRYDFILIIVDHLAKMIHYKLVQTTIDEPGVAKVIINAII